MQVADIVSLVANVGFPVTLCFILIKYVLQTVGDKLGKIETSLEELTEQVQQLESLVDEEKTGNTFSAKKII